MGNPVRLFTMTDGVARGWGLIAVRCIEQTLQQQFSVDY